MEANHLKHVRLSKREGQSEKSSNKQKYKWMASLGNNSYCRKKYDFMK